MASSSGFSNPASFPERPDNQRDRFVAMFSAAAGGLALGLLLVVFRELRDSSFKFEHDVVRTLNLPVLALVPAMATERELRSERRRAWFLDVTAAAALIGSVAFVVMWSLRA